MILCWRQHWNVLVVLVFIGGGCKSCWSFLVVCRPCGLTTVCPTSHIRYGQQLPTPSFLLLAETPQETTTTYSPTRQTKITAKSQQSSDFSFLYEFPTIADVEQWMNTIVVMQQEDSSIQTDDVCNSDASSSLLFQKDWTLRDEIAFVKALGHRGAVSAVLTFVNQGAQHSYHVDLFTAAFESLEQRVYECYPSSTTTTGEFSTTTTTTVHRTDSNHNHNNHYQYHYKKQRDEEYQSACFHLLDQLDARDISMKGSTVCALFRAYGRGPIDAKFLHDIILVRYPDLVWTNTIWMTAVKTCINTSSIGNDRRGNASSFRRRHQHQFTGDLTWKTAFEFFQEYEHQLKNDISTRRRQQKKTWSSRARTSVPILLAMLQILTITQNRAHANEFWNHVSNQYLPHLHDREHLKLSNAMLRVCAMSGDHEQARQILRQQQQQQQRTNEKQVIQVRSCMAYIQALSAANQLEQAEAFLEYMVSMNNGDETATSAYRNLFAELVVAPPDLVTVKALLKGCAKSGNFSMARKILTKLKNGEYGDNVPIDEHCYNMVLATCDDPIIAKELIREMRLSRRYRRGVVAPNHHTYTRAITVCRKARDLQSALFFLNRAKEDGLKPDVFMFTAAIWTAAQVGDAKSALDIFEEMESDGCSPTIVSCNGVLAALAACGMSEDAVSIFLDLRLKVPHVSPNYSTFYSLAEAIHQVPSPEEKLALLWRVFCQMGKRERRVEVGGPILKLLIAAYGKLEHFQESLSVFNSIVGPCDVGCLRAILFACAQANPPEWKIAISLLHSSDIVEGSVGPALVESGALCNAMLACSKADQWEESLQLLNLYHSGTKVSLVAVNSLIASCGHGGRPDMAVGIFNQLETYGLKPDQVSYRNAIIACSQASHKQHRKSNETPEELSIERPNWNKNKSSTSKQPKARMLEWWESALTLYRRMTEDGFHDIAALSSTISACEAAGRWQVALRILQMALDEEPRRNTDPRAPRATEPFLNLYCFNAAISACQKGRAWVEAMDIYERLKLQQRYHPHLRPNIVTLSSVILALDESGQKEMAIDLYREGLEQRYISSPWRTTIDSANFHIQIQALHLHNYSAAMARTVIRMHMNDLLMGGTMTNSFRRKNDEDEPMDWVIIVGKGSHSSDGNPVLGAAVVAVLSKEYQISARVDSRNAGRLIISTDQIRKLAGQWSGC